MAKHTGTWNSKDWNFQIDGLPITDMNGDVSFEAVEDDWEFTSGQNGAVERSQHECRAYNLTFPMMATTPQLDSFESLARNDLELHTGPYVFSAVHIIGGNAEGFKIVGSATITQIEPPTVGKVGSARNVKIHVDVEQIWRGV